MITKVTVDTDLTEIQAATPRRLFLLQNQGENDIYFSFEGTEPTLTAGANPGIRLKAGESYYLDFQRHSPASSGLIQAIADGGSSVVTLHSW